MRTILTLLLIVVLGWAHALPQEAKAATATWTDNSSGDGQEDYFVLERRLGAGSYFDIAHPITSAARQATIDLVLEQYRKAKA